MIRAVVFDLDDTLYPEQAFVFSGYRAVSEAVAQRLGFSIYDELVQLFRSGRRGDLFTPVLARHLGAVEESFVLELVGIYRSHRPEIACFPEVQGVIEAIRADHSTGLISDGIPEVQRRKLQALGIEELLDAVVLSGEFGRDRWKPHPLPYQACAARLSMTPADMVYVGDNPTKDFVTARKLGVKTVRIRRPGTLHRHVEAAPDFDADVTLQSLDGLPTAIARLAGNPRRTSRTHRTS